uniref:GRF-type domain-containing protein n=1 Tax=Lactuca sativa TaxID=4236 RepID=A0A9R1V2U9_LACSA|nr:hypothetical protein LSAT_V11C700387740 [Lactuca sativa]
MAASSSNLATSHRTKLVKCYCGDVCYVVVSRTPDNPGRKFWGCPNLKQEDELMDVMKIVVGLLMFIAIMLVIVVLKILFNLVCAKL